MSATDVARRCHIHWANARHYRGTMSPLTTYRYPEHIEVSATCCCDEALSKLTAVELKLRVTTIMSLLKVQALRARPLDSRCFLVIQVAEASSHRKADASQWLRLTQPWAARGVGWLLFLLAGLASMESSVPSATINVVTGRLFAMTCIGTSHFAHSAKGFG